MARRTRLENKVALITGAAQGIGEAASILFAREGARVVLVDLLAEEGGQVASRIANEGGEALFLQADLAQNTEIPRIVAAVVDRFGPPHILLNNAGFYGQMNRKSVPDVSEEVWDRTLDVNLRAAFLFCKHSIPKMIEHGGGSIINVSSIAGLAGGAEFAAYCTSKGALIQLTRCIAIDHARHNVRCNAICPGAIDTPGLRRFMEDCWDDYLREIASLTPLGRLGKPEDVARAALYLASDDSAYVTGTTLVVDGGRMAVA